MDGLHVEDVREAMLQTVLFAGFPRVINALWQLPPAKHERDVATRHGEPLCRRIYGRDYVPMMRKMKLLSPDLAQWILDDGYGKVLSRPRFDARERELLVVPTLAAMGAWRQLPSHVRGAINVGATAAEIRAVMKACRGLLSGSAIARVLKELR